MRMNKASHLKKNLKIYTTLYIPLPVVTLVTNRYSLGAIGLVLIVGLLFGS